MADTSTFSAALKQEFLGPIRDQLNSNHVLLFGLRKKDDKGQDLPNASRPFRGIEAEAEGIDHVGLGFRIPLRSSRNQGVGSRGEASAGATNAVLPAPGNQGYKFITGDLKRHYGLFTVTGPVMKAAKSDRGSFERVMTAEMEGVTDDLKRKLTIDAYRTGTGSLFAFTNSATSNTMSVDTTINLQGGEIIDIYDAALGTIKAAGRTITAYDRAARTITYSGTAVALVATDVAIRSSSDSTTGTPNNDLNACIDGLDKIVDATGALHGLNPATAGEQFWKSVEHAVGGAIVGDDWLRRLIDDIGFESGSDDDKVLITTRGIRNRYANTLTPYKRFNDMQSVKLHGGFTAVMFDETPLVVDDLCPKGTVWGLRTSSFMWMQASDWEWMDEDGDILKWEPRLDRYIAVLFKYANLGTTARNRHGKITGADDDLI